MGFFSAKKVKVFDKQKVLSRIDKIASLSTEEEAELKKEEEYTKQLYAIEEKIRKIDEEIKNLRNSAKVALTQDNDAEFGKYANLIGGKEIEKSKIEDLEAEQLKKKLKRIITIKNRTTIAKNLEASVKKIDRAMQGV
jgi:hypothetical protein